MSKHRVDSQMKEVRCSFPFKINQMEFSVLINVPLSTVRKHEQGVCGAASGFASLLLLLSPTSRIRKECFLELLEFACSKKHNDYEKAKAVVSLIKKNTYMTEDDRYFAMQLYRILNFLPEEMKNK